MLPPMPPTPNPPHSMFSSLDETWAYLTGDVPKAMTKPEAGGEGMTKPEAGGKGMTKPGAGDGGKGPSAEGGSGRAAGRGSVLAAQGGSVKATEGRSGSAAGGAILREHRALVDSIFKRQGADAASFAARQVCAMNSMGVGSYEQDGRV